MLLSDKFVVFPFIYEQDCRCISPYPMSAKIYYSLYKNNLCICCVMLINSPCICCVMLINSPCYNYKIDFFLGRQWVFRDDEYDYYS